ncbi:hypothetical protein JRO89_XS01G0026200 [Xanthoceras sorbifolium]|uniref:Expansin-like CBD domain-containing protein n=1 Tax=Xanthoceras sorbifolium TaxID=99658 RepID=A0ABQ8IHY2_9ROSI|nr:hypothetical protein JRO89_XS01G0026200 [Xanthoceras sorbifolium]
MRLQLARRRPTSTEPAAAERRRREQQQQGSELTAVECDYSGMNVVFVVDSGSNPSYFAVLIEFVEGDGTLAAVDLQQTSQSNTWLSMQRSWGAVWKLDSGSSLTAPFSLRLTAADSGETIVASNIIPDGWGAGQTYQSLVNFNV